MRARYRLFGRAFALTLTVGAVIAACAEGTEFEEPPGASGHDGGVDGGPTIPPGQIGGPCEEQADCVEGTCTVVGAGKICTNACPPTCPAKTYCAIVNGQSICVPDLDQLCLPCKAAIDCKNPSDQCLTAPLGDKFCAIDCSTLGTCPNGFTCANANEYASSSGSGGGGPGPDAGGGGGMGGGGPGDGGPDDAGPPGPKVPTKFCVPNSGFSCPCNKKRDGIKHLCEVENEFGSCKGSETCHAQSGKWVDCTALTPAAEACNGKDDDCDQGIDEGSGNDLCSAEGPPPAHAGWTCTAGVCSIAPCEPGWTTYPPGPPEEGCPCPVDMGEPNDTCGAATDAGSVSDAGGTLTLTGTLSSDTDVDVYVFTTVDTAEVNTNSYHVSIDLTSPAPNTEFLLDVTRGPMCSDAPSGPSSGITSYDWCVNGSAMGPNGAAMGEAPCGPQAAVHCNDNTSVYYVRVTRKAGETGTCSPYTVTVTAAGGDACDFASTCQ
ncbi:MAG TPA: hypothetical protein VE093_00570 [Polyangiaceae bacterium]|jgi:hypothetical protein|nr:hypothetical protein [Polyangiaceae bacterium]